MITIGIGCTLFGAVVGFLTCGLLAANRRDENVYYLRPLDEDSIEIDFPSHVFEELNRYDELVIKDADSCWCFFTRRVYIDADEE